MPRQSRSRSAPRPAPAQSRGAHTATAPYPGGNAANAPSAPHGAQASAQGQQRQPGMIAQMAATAGSVAVGSTIGHGISNMLFGGSSAAPPVEQQPPVAQQQQQWAGASCEIQAKEFTKCLEKADLQSCSWYLEQLKACQAAAAPY